LPKVKGWITASLSKKTIKFVTGTIEAAVVFEQSGAVPPARNLLIEVRTKRNTSWPNHAAEIKL
jgi:hypothetical protein